MHFAEARASLWIDGELVHLGDPVLHDATKDVRTPTLELTIARDVLKTHRRIAPQPPGWAATRLYSNCDVPACKVQIDRSVRNILYAPSNRMRQL
jgi:hypothetical protein